MIRACDEIYPYNNILFNASRKNISYSELNVLVHEHRTTLQLVHTLWHNLSLFVCCQTPPQTNFNQSRAGAGIDRRANTPRIFRHGTSTQARLTHC